MKPRKPLFAALSKSITISCGDGIPPNLTQNLCYIPPRADTFCRIEFRMIAMSHGDGIPPNLARNLDILRRVGTLSAVKQPSRKIKSLRTRRRKL